jgi:hypothetical protein
MVVKGVFVELKNEILHYKNLNIRGLITMDITVMERVVEIVEKILAAIFSEPEKYLLQRDFGQNINNPYGTDDNLINMIRKIQEDAGMDKKPDDYWDGIKNAQKFKKSETEKTVNK